MHIIMLATAQVAFMPVLKGTVLDLPEAEALELLERDPPVARLRDEPQAEAKAEGEGGPPVSPGSLLGTGNTAGPAGGDGTGNTAGAPGST